MQDIHCIGGGGGGIFAEGGGDRRLRPIHHQALNCPRCDSLNTKFCYYNNYNLSQPRHYCKNCRRYWTKGGVLRNVPVGGGVRKAKRAKPKSAESAVTAAPEQERKQQRDERKSNSHSGSEGSSLTAANSNLSVAINAANSSAGVSGNPNSGLGAGSLEEQGADCGLFSSETGNFSTSNETLSFCSVLNQQGFDQVHEWHNQNQNQQGGVEIRGRGLEDQTEQSRSDGGAFGSFDWLGSGNQGLFDFTNAVDHTYWNQHHQWTDQDQHSFYLP